jgi:uncharacterized protein (DUF2236 family)
MEHSAFVDDPFGRVYRSIPQIWATLLAVDRRSRGQQIRDLHRGISGMDEAGSRYHALHPDTFWWAHATFTWMMFRSIELFHAEQLDAARRETLYQDTVAWYEGYGVSMRPVPPDYDAFAARFAAICASDLQLTPTARQSIAIASAGEVALPLIPARVNRTARPLLGPVARALAFGCLPSSVRQRFAIPWAPADQARLRLLCGSMRRGFQVVPDRANRSSLQWALRTVGARTRGERFVPAA